MPRRSENAARHSLATMMLNNEKLPWVAVTKALVRAGFLVTNSPSRPNIKLGINLSQVDVLAALARSEAGLKCSEIAETTLITKGGITGILDRLETRGLAQRIPSRDDRRSIRIQLTDKGVDFCQELFAQLVEANERIFGKALAPEQIRQLTKLLTLVVRSIETGSQPVRSGVSEPIHGHQRI